MLTPNNEAPATPIPQEEVLDLSNEIETSEVISSPALVPYDPRPKEDGARRWIAFSLIALLAVVIISSMIIYTLPGTDKAELKDFLNLILSPLFALVSAATGFYYATKK
jgi:hypothetical protein